MQVLELELHAVMATHWSSGLWNFTSCPSEWKLSEIIWQNLSSKTHLMVFNFADGRGRECECEREGAREEESREEQRKTHGYMVVKETLGAACQNAHEPMWISSIKCTWPNNISINAVSFSWAFTKVKEMWLFHAVCITAAVLHHTQPSVGVQH